MFQQFHLFFSGCIFDLPYQQTVSLSAVARCFPTTPTLALLNPVGDQIANSSFPAIGPPVDAYRVPLMVTVNQIGKYTFRHFAGTVESIFEVTAEPMIMSSLLSSVLLTETNPSQTLTCVARSYPC